MTKDRQLGRIKISAPLVHSGEVTEALVMMGFLALRVEYIWEYDYYMYTGTSHLFEAIPEGVRIPLYNVIIGADYSDNGEVIGPLNINVEIVLDEKEGP